jgi:uroporphyrin-3 C-methyltransferase
VNDPHTPAAAPSESTPAPGSAPGTGPVAEPANDSAPASTAPVGAAPGAAAGERASRAPLIAAAVLALLSLAALGVAWNAQQRVRAAELELVKRQQDASTQSAEARTLARNAEASARDAVARLALLEARIAESSLQRTQLEELIQSLARSRDENVLADIDASIRVAMQQSAITGSVEPLATALRQADERLARYPQPRLERVRRAVLQDIDRVKAAAQVDLPTVLLRLDEAVRLADDLPLVAAVDRRPGRSEARALSKLSAPAEAASASAAARPASAASGTGAAGPSWPRWIGENARLMLAQAWSEVRALVQVSRIDDPDAALLAPEQAFFVRENVKLRLLNARLALLSRQYDIAQADLRDAQSMIDRYFDRGSRRVVAASDQVRQLAGQARQVALPRPDATLAALATAVAGR